VRVDDQEVVRTKASASMGKICFVSKPDIC
jgi:hypothetical protein